MPLDLHVIRASEFIRLDARAQLDFAASEKALQALARACLKRGIGRALLDLRRLPAAPKPQFTSNELAALVWTFREAGFSRQQRLAVLYHEDVHGGVRTFAFISRMRGLKVQAFSEFEAALEWLSEQPDTRGESRPGEVPIPIIQRQRELKKLSMDLTAEGPGIGASRMVRRTMPKQP